MNGQEDVRVVRIARKPSLEKVERAPPARARPSSQRREAAAPAKQTFRNVGGVHRSVRTFTIGFFLLPLLVWAVVAVLFLTSPYPGVRSNGAALVDMTTLLVAVVGGGYWLTLGRTPKAFVYFPRKRSLHVVHFEGGVDRMHLDPEAFQSTIEVQPRDIFAPDETELIEFHDPPYKPRRWVVERRLLDPLLPRHPPPRGGIWGRKGTTVREDREDERERRAKSEEAGSGASSEEKGEGPDGQLP